MQAKIDLPFCIDLRAGMLRHVSRVGKVENHDTNPIHVESFMMVLDKTSVFQYYEHTLLRNVFDRVDRTRCGFANLLDLTVSFTLLATGSDPQKCVGQDEMRMKKLRFLFNAFDRDADGCLTCEELLRMYCSIAIYSAIASQDQPSYDADVALGDELSLSKARRLYDFTSLFLKQSGVEELPWWNWGEGIRI